MANLGVKGLKAATSIISIPSASSTSALPSNTTAIRQKGFLNFEIEFYSVVHDSCIRAKSEEEIHDTQEKRHRAEVELSRLRKLLEVGVLKDSNPEDKEKIANAENSVAKLKLLMAPQIIANNRKFRNFFNLFWLCHFCRYALKVALSWEREARCGSIEI